MTRDLPGVHGDDVRRRLVAEERDCRVLMLTAAGAVEDRVDGLRLGADDYLPKPFDASELVARIQALSRRTRSRAAPLSAPDGDLTLDSARRLVTRGGTPLVLRPQGVRRPRAAAHSPGRGRCRPRNCSPVCWDENADPFTNAVKTTVESSARQAGGSSADRDRRQSRLQDPGLRWRSAID